MSIPVTLTNIGSAQQITSASTTINTNNTNLVNALATALSTQPTSPNSMNTSLDMNNNQILNLPAPTTQDSPVRVADLSTSGNATIVIGLQGPPTSIVGQYAKWASTDGTKLSSGPILITDIPAAGLNTQLIYNNAGIYAGTGGINFNATDQSLTLIAAGNPASSTLTLIGANNLMTSQPVLNMTQTWNNVATTFTGLKLNITNTNSANGSKLMDIQLGGVSTLSVATSNVEYPAGWILNFTPNSGSTVSLGPANGGSLVNIIQGGQSSHAFNANNNFYANDAGLQWTNLNRNPGTTVDVGLFRDSAPGFLAIANTQTLNQPASLRVYNTTDQVFGSAPTNYERGVFDWNTTSNVLTIGTQKGGTGSTRGVQFVNGGTNMFDIGITHAGETTFANTGGSVPQLAFSTGGGTDIGFGNFGSGVGSTLGVWRQGVGQPDIAFALVNSQLAFANPMTLAWSTNSNPGSTQDVGINRMVAKNLAIFNPQTTGANATGLQVYNNYDTSSNPGNYERGVFDWTTTTNVLTIGTQKLGTGAIRNLQFVVGSTNVLDYGITNANTFTFASSIVMSGAGGYVQIGSSGYFGWNNGTNITSPGSGAFVFNNNGNSLNFSLLTDAANAMALVNGTNAQSLRVYNTSSSANANYERGIFDWGATSNTLTIGTQNLGTGVARPVAQIAGGTEVIRLLTAGNVKFSNAASFSANGSVATVLGSVGPTGSNTTVQKWLTFQDSGGATRYVPCF
jgi:hypothetical protein